MNSSEVSPISGLLEGKYELVGMIGRGGMGSVWEAKHHTLGTRFAIKFIEAEYADSAEARKRFDNEARAAATIQSKHAIQIYDHGITRDGKPFIVMELLVAGEYGGPLDKILERNNGHLTLQRTAEILTQVSRGLARAHEKGIVHRDLKPENIFLVESPEDGELIAKVLDFGIAKITGDATNPSLTSSTKTGAVLGTPFYMSPEQARGLRNVDHRTDVWSLGVIAFKCVTGRLPFDGESVGDLLVKICTAPIPVPSQAAAGLNASFDAWFMRALDREPDRRFQNVSDLANGLAHAAGIASRGAGPFSGAIGSGQQATVAAGQPQIIVTPPPGAMPPYATPNPALREVGAATAAPFTSSTPVPGVPQPGRAKYFVFAALAGLLVAGGAGGGFMYVKKHTSQAGENAVGITPATPPSSAAIDPPPPASSGDVKPPDTTTPSSATPLAQNNPPKDATKSGASKAGLKGGAAVPAKGATTHDATAAATPPPHDTSKTTTPPPVPPPAKTSHPANKDDPGY
jgi:serine/threonine-protein kinase